jgi:hypothetical protein
MTLPSGTTLLSTCIDQLLKFQETFYIKDFLIACGLPHSSPWLDERSPFRSSLWKSLFVETAYLAAVFHDLGYPWQYLGLLSSKIEHAITPGMSNPTAADAVLATFRKRLLYTAMSGYRQTGPTTPATWSIRLLEQTRDALALTHGFPGALSFLFLNDRIRTFPTPAPNPIRELCVEWAATAIMMHDMGKIYWGEEGREKGVPEKPHLRVQTHVDPLSALITLADKLQDFERPEVEFSSDFSTVNLKYDVSCDESSIEINPAGNALISYKMSAPAALAVKKSRLHRECEETFGTRYGYLDLRSWGIRKVDMQAL